MTYERENIKRMEGYTSGEQPDSPDIIKLNTNENPFPPGPAVAQALAGISVNDLRRYPQPTASHLRDCLAIYHQLGPTSGPDNIIVTKGGDELLRLAISTFVEEAESIAVAAPGYSLYDVLATAHGCSIQKFDLDNHWKLPENFASKLNQSGAKICFVVNPHAPSGQLCSVAELRQLANDFQGVLFIDEAYVDFVDPEIGYDSTPLINEFDNVLILRTFSKGFSLAGLRIAYGLGAQSLIDPMQYKTKDSYNTDFIAQTLATAAIENYQCAAETWSYVRNQRDYLKNQLDKIGFISNPSQSNFLLVTVPAPFEAENIYQSLKQKGILIRYFNLPRLQDKLRISIGTEAENNILITILKEIIS